MVIYSNGFSAFSWRPLMNQINATGVTADVQSKMFHMLRNFKRCESLRIIQLDLYTEIVRNTSHNMLTPLFIGSVS
jgi:hypothetical protein